MTWERALDMVFLIAVAVLIGVSVAIEGVSIGALVVVAVEM